MASIQLCVGISQDGVFRSMICFGPNFFRFIESLFVFSKIIQSVLVAHNFSKATICTPGNCQAIQ